MSIESQGNALTQGKVEVKIVNNVTPKDEANGDHDQYNKTVSRGDIQKVLESPNKDV